MHKARVIYNEFENSFDIDIQQEDGTWGLSSRFSCNHCLQEKDAMQKSANFISWEILPKIKELAIYGYDICLLGEWIKER